MSETTAVIIRVLMVLLAIAVEILHAKGKL